MTSTIHPTAIIAPGARIGDGCFIGPYCIIGAQVVLGANVRLHSHVILDGDTEIGEDTEIYPFASIGTPPQDKKFKGEKTKLIVGKRTTIREQVTMNPGTEGGGGITRVGDDCMFLTATHVAHDCQVGNGVIMSNNSALAGHVTVGNGVIIGGLSAVHQFVRIGDFAFIGGMVGITKDVIPYGMVMHVTESLGGLNLVGLKRRGVSREGIHALRNTYQKLFFGEGTLADRAAALHTAALGDEAQRLLDFVLQGGSRSFCTPTESREAA